MAKSPETNGHIDPAKAYPSKSFFIDMLTQDIGLSDCILDLIDNSINSLVVRENLDVMQHLIEGSKAPKIKATIDITFNPAKFTISDNCGGISLSDAQNQVFLFGKPKVDKTHAGLGVYGIGMKRAFFKIGRQIDITSNTIEEQWKISINVDEWESKPDKWEFDFADHQVKKAPVGKTALTVARPSPTIAAQFGMKSFAEILRARIASAYALFITSGLSITLNSHTVTADLPELVESAEIKPVRKLFKEDGVDILIQAGLTPRSDRTPRGWYVFCNGRLVLPANQTDQTGWGLDEFPVFHSKYNHFYGRVCFRSKDVRKLPWTTTKDGVTRESPIYQKALSEMRVQARPVLDFFNRLYPDDPAESEQERESFDKAKPTSAEKAASQPNTPFQAPPPKPRDDVSVKIQYSRPKKQVKKIAAHLQRPNMSAVRVGEHTFDAFYERYCK
jgi:hypothetical protein